MTILNGEEVLAGYGEAIHGFLADLFAGMRERIIGFVGMAK